MRVNRIQVDAEKLLPGDVIPNLGTVTKVLVTPVGVTITTSFSTSSTHVLAHDHPVWVDRESREVA